MECLPLISQMLILIQQREMEEEVAELVGPLS
jgi:hypothetical protein